MKKYSSRIIFCLIVVSMCLHAQVSNRQSTAQDRHLLEQIGLEAELNPNATISGISAGRVRAPKNKYVKPEYTKEKSWQEQQVNFRRVKSIYDKNEAEKQAKKNRQSPSGYAASSAPRGASPYKAPGAPAGQGAQGSGKGSARRYKRAEWGELKYECSPGFRHIDKAECTAYCPLRSPVELGLRGYQGCQWGTHYSPAPCTATSMCAPRRCMEAFHRHQQKSMRSTPKVEINLPNVGAPLVNPNDFGKSSGSQQSAPIDEGTKFKRGKINTDRSHHGETYP